jgi:hypothetical protein
MEFVESKVPVDQFLASPGPAIIEEILVKLEMD